MVKTTEYCRDNSLRVRYPLWLAPHDHMVLVIVIVSEHFTSAKIAVDTPGEDTERLG